MTATSSSPCRSWPGTPATARHRCSAEHAETVSGYRDARLAWEARAEEATRGQPPGSEEWRDFARADPPMTWHRWLTSMRRDQA